MIFGFLKKLCKSKPRAISFYGRTDTGMVRGHNEDSFCSLRNRRLFVVADGMGGHNAGEIASRLAIEALLESLSEEKIREIRGNDEKIHQSMLEAFHHANQAVMNKASADETMKGMGCTMVACLLDENRLHTCHVGDARCYLSEKGVLKQITTDHTAVTYVQRIDANNKEIQVPRHVVTRAIGFNSPEGPEYHKNIVLPGTRVLLCSDGLWNMIDHTHIEQILLNASSPEKASETLVKAANDQGGRDNITALVIFY
ncbi:PP2C family protein-serine/threonine phosphatase [Thiovibrio frasassiensis]|uniref:Protein phosphatase 2C domain-containing protein n=1 Tax=Thiovibrio frasassiensis TaxID=2984131 RepID=A0A9X4RLW2_9BACT|nr:protein phosphatase 2C domain-containing protein [Thiovibrio frasassiensis]MDG4476481.1 protein phosphatase 2C domain-containing protein [Thiovibrio frasassiensis]